MRHSAIHLRLLTLALITLLFGFNQKLQAQDFNQLRSRCRVQALAMYSEGTSVSTLLNRLNANGSWTDRDLDTYIMEQRILKLAQAYYEDPAWMGNATLKNAIYRSMYYYFENIQYTGHIGGWTAQGLRVPRAVGMIANLMHDDIYADRNGNSMVQAVYDHILATFNMAFANITGRPGNMLGPNLSSRLRGATYIAAFAHDTGMMGTVQNQCASSMEQGAGMETQGVNYSHVGITTDFSFHHHNADGGQNIWNNYGIVWLDELAKYVDLVGGTPFDMQSAQYQLIYDAITQGLQYFIYRTEKVYAVCGRNALKPNLEGGIGSMVLQRWLDAAPSNAFSSSQFARLQQIEQNFRRVALEPDLIDTRYFFTSDMLVQARQNHHLTLRMASDRTASLEQGIGVDVYNYHMGHGATYLLKNGQEYNMARIGWNTTSIPGTTAEQSTTDMPLQARTGNTLSLNTFAGGLSNGTHAVAGFDLHRAQTDYFNIRGNKGYFFFDGVFGMLGSALTQTAAAGEQIWTTLDQTLWQTPIRYNAGSGLRTVNLGNDVQRSFNVSSPAWFHQNGVGYIIIPNGTVNVRMWAETRTGRWHDIDGANGTADGYRDVEIFHLIINHGNNPQQASYEYLVVPEIDASEMEAYVANLPTTLVRNDAQVQALYHAEAGISQALFYVAGQTANFPNGLSLYSNRPAATMLEQTADSLIFYVADPNQNQDQISLRVNRYLSGANVSYDENSQESTITFDLPDNMYEGQKVRRAFALADMVIPQIAPVANIAYATTQAYAPITVNFDASGSSDADGNITAYFWDMGDGNLTNGTFISHTYVNPGTYTVLLTVRDNDNLTAIDTVNVIVHAEPEPAPDPIPAPLPPAPIPGLPSPGCLVGWGNTDIGTVGAPGSACESNGVFAMETSGQNIWGNSDGFHYVYKKLTGNGEIIARVTDAEFVANWANSGVMIRESLDADAAFVYANMTDYGRWAMLYRTATGGNAATRHSGSNQVSLPYYVRLVRDGDRFRSFVSQDGTNWRYWRAITVPMTEEVYIGLASASTNTEVLRTVSFDNVSLDGTITDIGTSPVNPEPTGCLPSEWLNTDVGAVDIAGQACSDNGVFSVTASGSQIWDNEDGFHYVYQQMKGDGEIIARVDGLDLTDNWASAGVMMRESLAPNAKQASANVTASGRYTLYYRSNTDGNTDVRHSGSVRVDLPYWVRLVRSGNRFTSYFSADGTNWQEHRTATISMAPIIMVGMATTAHNNSVLNVSTYSNVSLAITSPTDGTLPVELISFDATANPHKGRVDLNWETASEVNNSHFIIERSMDGFVFGAIDEVKGAGNSTEARAYEAFDTNPLEGKLFYRLRQTDFDGSIQYSEVKEVRYGPALDAALSAYPVPAVMGTTVHADFFLPESQDATVRLLNRAGQVVWQTEAAMTVSGGQVDIPTEGLSSGFYYIQVQGKQLQDEFKAMKLIIMPR